MIHVGFSRSKKFSIGGLAIRIFQGWTEFSHTYIKFLDPDTGELMVFEASHGTVHLTEMSRWQKKNTVVFEKGIIIGDENFKNFLKFSMRALGTPYSFANILGIFIKRITGKNLLRDGRSAYICSELVAYALRDKYRFPKVLDYVTPKDIYDVVRYL